MDKAIRRRVSVVPHTHWDREWYSPFQVFRMNLVDLVDDLLTLMESDPSYSHFMLDGQVAVIDDYLEVRGGNLDRLRRLCASGRLSVGPWYILMDEFLVSAETMVRNMQLGLERGAQFGGTMQVGYLPDMFGHIAQMPQILDQFGMQDAVVWRGVPSQVTNVGFVWVAPDGSSVRAEYMPQGYGNGGHLPRSATDLIDQVTRFTRRFDELSDGDILWMNGTDHMVPSPHLGRLTAEANSIQDDLEFVVTSLPEHLARRPRDGLQVWRGELRSGARTNLLMGVTSNRTDVRQAAARVEVELERRAEPLSAIFSPPDQYPSELLRLAWREVIRNSAHDSICACSADDVVGAVLNRYSEAGHIASGLTRRALKNIGRRFATEGPFLVNPSHRRRNGIAELTVAGDIQEGPAVQVLSTSGDIDFGPLRLADGLVTIDGAIEDSPLVESVEIRDHDGSPLEVSLWTSGAGVEGGRATGEGAGSTRPPDALEALRAMAAVEPERPVVMKIKRPTTKRVLLYASDIDGFGWKRWSPDGAPVAPAVAEGNRLANGVIEVMVADDGTYSIRTVGPERQGSQGLGAERIEADGAAATAPPGSIKVAGLGRLVSGGDVGDTYNWCPPENETIVDAPVEAKVTAVESGPLRARLVLESRYVLPARAVGANRVGEVVTKVRTTLELQAGSPLLRVTTEFENRARDHRLRAHFPLPEPADRSEAECAFAVVERGLVAQGGPTEKAMPTYPSRRFVVAGGLTFVHEGLPEYELVDIVGDGDLARARTLAVTLLRCTGMLAQQPMETRLVPAGPLKSLEGSQQQGGVKVRYGIALGVENPYEIADDLLVPVLAVRAQGSGDLDDEGSALEVNGAQISAVQRVGGLLEVRVFNPSQVAADVSLPGRSGWLVDLRGRSIEAFDETFELRPWGIATARLCS